MAAWLPAPSLPLLGTYPPRIVLIRMLPRIKDKNIYLRFFCIFFKWGLDKLGPKQL